MSEPATDDGIEVADLGAFLVTEDSTEVHHADVMLNGKLSRFYYRDCSRTEALRFAKLADEGTEKSLAEFDRQVLATLCVDPTPVKHADVVRWQKRKGSQAALGQLVQDVIVGSGFVAHGSEETERFPE